MIVDKIKKRQVPTNNKTSNIDIPVGKWIKCEECKEIPLLFERTWYHQT